MEGNLKIITKMIQQYGVEATPQAKEAIANFAVLYAQKLVRTCILNKQSSKKVSAEEIRSAYQLTKMLHTPQYELELEERKKESIRGINSSVFFSQKEQQKEEKYARSAVTVKLFNSQVYHMSMGREKQLTYE